MWGLPINASAHGYEIDSIIIYVHILMLVLFLGWGAFFIFTLVRFNRRVHPKADYTGVKSHLSTKLEIAVVIIEAVLLVGFSIPFWAKHVNAFPNRTDTIEVRIVAEQYAWNIHYPGKDGMFGKTSPKLMDSQNNPLGIDSTDPNAADDFVTINQLHLPIGRPVVVHLSTKDVIHSFALPVMRVKQDAIPGMSIPVWFTPIKTGDFEIACAQLCGIGHYRMKGFLNIHSPEEYAKWVSEQETIGASSSEGGADSFWN
ncbi:MAG: cytochrome c oxidase subunit II [Candidatus Omnitrophica bacterium]|nr:cytochrome c oxidase subunit II [Candidatus Omnitrophota bacterium]